MAKETEQEIMDCSYCGKKNEEHSFVIGYTPDHDWCMWSGTGEVSCPDCYEKGSAASDKAHQKAELA